jgi:hypothetical protein
MTPGASYYDVQVYREGEKVYEAWPSAPSLTLPKRWSYRGRSYRLSSGRLIWYVWPGFGARAEADYRKAVEKHLLLLR